MKRQPTEKKIFIKHIFNKVPYSDYIKNPYETVTKRRGNDRKWEKNLNRQFSKTDTQITNESHSGSLSTRKYMLNHNTYPLK